MRLRSVDLRRATALAVAGALVCGVSALASHGARDSGPGGADLAAASTPVASPSVTPTASAVASPAPSAVAVRPSPAASPARLRSTGRLAVVPGRSAVGGTGGAIRRYFVEVERGLPVDAAAFAAAVQRTLADPRGWGHAGRMRFQRVSSGPVAFRVTLASPATTDRLCRPLRTNGTLSCHMGSRAVINARRWLQGAVSYRGHLAEYRQYVVSHEVGHALGHGHQTSCRSDGRAPVMMQQTKSLYGCTRNPWPYPAR